MNRFWCSSWGDKQSVYRDSLNLKWDFVALHWLENSFNKIANFLKASDSETVGINFKKGGLLAKYQF